VVETTVLNDLEAIYLCPSSLNSARIFFKDNTKEAIERMSHFYWQMAKVRSCTTDQFCVRIEEPAGQDKQHANLIL
jgi:hypothetical protein